MKHLLTTIVLLFFGQPLLTGQKTMPGWLSVQSSQRHHLLFQYFRLDRKKIGNGVDAKLNTDFGYLNPFDGGQRFAPDEPSSFSSLEYCFHKKKLSETTGYQVAAGVYRNHIKGDFLLIEHTVHFGRGNSQVGICASTAVWVQVLKLLEIAGTFQFGAGPHFTKLTAGPDEVSPKNWGARGCGLVSNIGLWANSPIFFNRLAFGVGTVYNYTYSQYGDFKITDASNGEGTNYENVHFTAVSKRPKPTVLFKYYFCKYSAER